MLLQVTKPIILIIKCYHLLGIMTRCKHHVTKLIALVKAFIIIVRQSKPAPSGYKFGIELNYLMLIMTSVQATANWFQHTTTAFVYTKRGE